MTELPLDRAIAIVGVGSVLPDAPDVSSFWRNLTEGRYSIRDVPDGRWDVGLYYDADPKAPDKTYSKIGGWVEEYEWDPMAWRMPIPPKVGEVMDPAQKWAVAACRQALIDYGHPARALDHERTAVILGNALGGDFHLRSASRILFPEIGDELGKAPSFLSLPEHVRGSVMEELLAGVRRRIPDITEDTMPGELANIVAGRVAALYDFKGPNYIADAACASAMAAMSAAVEGLVEREYDAVLTGGIDANMSPSTFVKFSKIGALSATGTRPYAEGADGFVMGEGAACFLLKRLEDAERDGDRVYAVIIGVGGSSDGKGKGITAPNPAGQKLAVRRGWERAGVSPATGDMLEGHGTSTRVGDVVEAESLAEVFSGLGLPRGALALGSVKSNIGHLKGAAGAAGVLKATLALHNGTLLPSINFHAPNPNFDFASSPLAVNTETRPWDKQGGNGAAVRRAGVSAFGFGGTNFHVVLEQYVPGLRRRATTLVQGAELRGPVPLKVPLRGAMLVGADTDALLTDKLRAVEAEARAGHAPEPAPPRTEDLRSAVRVAIDYDDADTLAELAGKAVGALESGEEGRWRALRNKGVFLGRGEPGKVAFLFTGQGSQYVGMLNDLRHKDSVVAETFREADRVMTPILERALTAFIFTDSTEADALAEAEENLKQTAITQPALLTVDTALARFFASYGVEPDLVMGHSLGEYGALVSSGAMDFGDALTAVAARGDAMTRLALEDNGVMAAVFGPVDEVSGIVEGVDGYVVVANVNSRKECVIGGATDAVEAATEALKGAGYRVALLPVSHAFHTRIVEPAAAPLRDVLRGLALRAPKVPVIANVDAGFYPVGPDAGEKMVEILGRQIGSPVQFVKGLEKLYEAGARVFVEMGPKRALYAMADNVVGERDGVTVLFTNHPRSGDVVAVNRALCGFYALGLGAGAPEAVVARPAVEIAPTPGAPVVVPVGEAMPVAVPGAGLSQAVSASAPSASPGAVGEDRYVTLGRMFADFMDRSLEAYSGSGGSAPLARVGITGASLGLPGTARVFDESNLPKILGGEGLIGPVPDELRGAMLDRRITRLVKGSNGEARFETINDPEDVIKLAGRAGALDLVQDFGFPEDRLRALDWVTQLAIAAGIDALRDAGIPLVRRYKSTTTGSKLPVGWSLPAEMRDDTGVIFGSAFPGYDQFARAMHSFSEHRELEARVAELRELRETIEDAPARAALDKRIEAHQKRLDEKPYHFDRRFLFQVLSMGHSQFAEYIGARGPNVATNAACATGTQAVAMAQDWIQTGRCKRAIVITADDVTTDHMFPWFGSGFLASGAAATDARIEDAALPFDRRRHGLLVGMGGASLVVEDLNASADRGVQPICEILGSVVANSAFHGSRLDIDHIVGVMESLISDVEARWGLDRHSMAQSMVFVSHETYTPARGGSASAEVYALRNVFGASIDSIVVANTKGFTGHPMGVAIEDVLAVKMLETGIVPPVANYREVDPDLGTLNLSRGGSQPVHYALRLGAGFGSQISMSVVQWTPPPDGARRDPNDLGFEHRVSDPARWDAWLRRVTGYAAPELEVVQRTLRVKDQGPDEVGVRTAWAAAQRPSPPAPVAAAPLVPATPVLVESPAPEAPASRVVAGPSAMIPNGPQAGPPPSSDPSPTGDPVAETVLAIVAEQTGYPPDMLAMDLDLEADLGIDTVKQAEMFAAIRDAYDIERDENLALRDYPTLARAVEFVYEKRPDLKATAGEVAPAATGVAPGDDGLTVASAGSLATTVAVGAGMAAAAGEATTPVTGAVAAKVLSIVAEQTGYPPDMLELDLDLEADLGIDTVKQAEMFAAIRDAYDIERDEDLALRDYPTLARAIEFVYEKRPDLRDAAPEGTASASAGAVSFVSGAQAAVPGPDASETVAVESGVVAVTTPDSVAGTVLAIVAEQTGYPPDMLELDLDLEADLGIDTVKQAEMFAAIRDAYDIERDEDLALRDYPTLARAIEFVYEKRPDLKDQGAGEPAATDVATVTAQALDTSPVEPAPPAAPAAPSGGDARDGQVAETVLAIVAEQTGYPRDMLELDLDLEADLGIDTVKQAEMFAAIRDAYDIERDEDLALRDYPTLAHAIEFVFEKRPDLRHPDGDDPDGSGDTPDGGGDRGAEAAEAAPDEGPEGATAGSGPTHEAVVSDAEAADQTPHEGEPPPAPGWPHRILGSMEAAQAVPRRVPVAVLRPPSDRCPPSRVSLDANARVVVAPDEWGIGVALVERLEKMGVSVFVADPSQDTDRLVRDLEAWRGDGPVTGLYWLPALDSVLASELSDPEDRQEAFRRRVKALHAVARALFDDLSGPDRFLVSGVRLGGRHGYEEEGANDAAGGAVTGFTKAFARERPEAVVKTVDFEPSRKTAALAAILVDETLRDPGVVEVGYAEGRRWTVGLEEQPVEPGPPLGRETVYLVTGAAGSIVSAIVDDLAVDRGTFWLLDLAPEPDAADPDLERLVSDREGLKRELFARLQAEGERATPVRVEQEIARLERAHAAAAAMETVRSARGSAHYRSVDLTDSKAVSRVVSEILETSGRVDVLLHAAGLEISRGLPDKSPEEFSRVFDVKVEGWYNLMTALGDNQLDAVITFSSIAGRFGNAGQTDYAAANDLLCKAVSQFRRTRPQTRALSLDWTAWRDIGMAARGSIPAIMRAAGIDMLAPEAGIAVVRRELTAGTRGEAVIAEGLGVMLEEDPETATLDGDFLSEVLVTRGPMVGRLRSLSVFDGVVVETGLDPRAQPFLDHHRINGTAVLPGVMGLEAMAEAAQLAYPELHLASLEGVEFHAPFKFYRDEPRMVRVEVSHTLDGEHVLASCKLIGSRTLVGRDEHEITTHFTGRVRLTPEPVVAERQRALPKMGGVSLEPRTIYETYFHGPAYQVIGEAWGGEGLVAGRFAEGMPVNHHPEGRPMLASPRLIELAFQTAGLAEIALTEQMGLPRGFRRLELVRPPVSEAGTAVVRPRRDGSFDVDVTDGEGRVVLSLRGYRTAALPGSIDSEAFQVLKG